MTGCQLLACLPACLCRRGLAVSITSLGKEKPPTLNPDVVTPEGAEAVDPRVDSAMTTASAATTASDGVDPRSESALKRLSGTYRVDYQVSAAIRVLCAGVWVCSGCAAVGTTSNSRHRHQPCHHCICPMHLPPPLQRYPISGYIKLPAALQPCVQLPIMDHVIVVAKPSGDISGGLDNYREVNGLAACRMWLLAG